MSGTRYFVIFIDDFLRKIWLYVLKSKGNCFEKFKEFQGLVEIQLHYKIKTFWLDNGRMFVSKALNQFLKDHSIEKQTSIPYTLQQNAVVEHANRTIVEMTKNMLYTQKLKKSIWTKSVVNVVYIQNRCQQGRYIPLCSKKYEAETYHALYTCVGLIVLPTQWYQMHKG